MKYRPLKAAVHGWTSPGFRERDDGTAAFERAASDLEEAHRIGHELVTPIARVLGSVLMHDTRGNR